MPGGCENKMITKVFRCGKMDRRARRCTVAVFVLLAAVMVVVWYFWGDGGYVTAWTASFIVAVCAFFIMSVPRRIVVGETGIEIRCLVEVTHISYADLRSIRRLDAADMKKKYLVLGSYGFFGYYGFYRDGRTWETLKLYCTRWDDFVEITDACEQRYVVSCPQTNTFLEAVNEAMRNFTGETETGVGNA